MKACIHRGSEQIGGSCIEVESQGQRLLIDCGLPLDATGNPRQHLPASLRLDGPPIAAVVISHGHLDHYGLLAGLGGDIPVAMGAAGRRILAAAAPFMGRWRNKAVPAGWDLCARKPMRVGPFTVTPYQVDHSAYDAYALLIEADGRRLFYSGDFRMHGRKARVMEALMSRPPKDIDALLVEGSSFGRMEPAGAFPSEQDIEGQMLDAFRRTPGMALVHVSAQNIDRVVSIFRASKRSGRTLVIDLYAAAIFAATDNQHIPQSHWNEVALFIPQRQRVQIKNRKLFDLLHAHDAHRIYPQHLKRDPGRYTLLFRSLHMKDLERSQCLSETRYICSQWEGYWSRPDMQKIAAWLDANTIPKEHIHTSGHADIAALQRFAQALAPEVVVPIHTFAPQGWDALFPCVRNHHDGAWWAV